MLCWGLFCGPSFTAFTGLKQPCYYHVLGMVLEEYYKPLADPTKSKGLLGL